MELRHVILHEVVREEEGGEITKNLRTEENTLSGLGQKLTNELLELFAQANLNVGEFSIKNDTKAKPAFEQKLEEHYDKSNKTKSFVDLTRSFAENYFSNISKGKGNVGSVKGGILVFYEYEGNAQDIILGVAVVERIKGINADINSLDLDTSNFINLKQLHLGASINLTKWRSKKSNRYIKFKTGKVAEVRIYFEEFIGCQLDKEAAKRETKKLKDAIKAYAKTLQLNSDEIQKRLDIASSFINSEIKSGNDPLLSSIANAVFASSPEEFLKLVKKEPYELSENITIHSGELKKYTRIGGSGKGISINFDNELLGTSVIYSAKDKTLRFNDLPEILVDNIKEVLASREKKDEE